MKPASWQTHRSEADAPAGADAFINRELSNLSFIERVLDEGEDESVSLTERVRFVALANTALDEFFMIRVAGLKRQLASGVDERGPDGLDAQQQLAAIGRRCRDIGRRQDSAVMDRLLPLLEQAGVRFEPRVGASAEAVAAAIEHCVREVLPVLTPIVLDPGHPFPHLRNKSLNLLVAFSVGRLRYGVVPVPSLLSRIVRVPQGMFLLEDAIALCVARLFPDVPIAGCWAFRVTRNWDLNVDEEKGEDLLLTIEREVRRRDRGSAVRLQLDARAGEDAGSFLRGALALEQQDVYPQRRPLALTDFLASVLAQEELKGREEPAPAPAPGLVGEELYDAIRERDVLLHHPYESFESVVSFLETAAEDPRTLAIKMTLYRAGAGYPIVHALQRAAENGKQVTVLVELKARMDEETNIAWARELERAGVHVVYGLLGLKTHCKLALVVRREGSVLRRYVHFGTGNYDTTTARQYSDLSLFTSGQGLVEDATALFNLLTGYSRPQQWAKLLVSPLGLKQALLALIDDEATSGERGRITAKMNALADPDIIRALYRASRRGVQIDLLVRGVCCLRPGVPGLSETIRVSSVVDRYLEHARIWGFHARGAEKLYLASGDWMQRDFVGRVDVAIPIDDPGLKDRLRREILGTMLADNVKARSLQPDGDSARGQAPAGEVRVRSQEQFSALARRAALVEAPQPLPAGGALLGGPRRSPRTRKRS